MQMTAAWLAYLHVVVHGPGWEQDASERRRLVASGRCVTFRNEGQRVKGHLHRRCAVQQGFSATNDNSIR